MELHRGRLIPHVHLWVPDIAASKRFYQVVLRSLKREIDCEGEGYFFANESTGLLAQHIIERL